MRRTKEQIDLIDERRRDGQRALVEGREHAEAVNKNMARLRALRLEREAAGEAPQQEEEKKPKQRSALAKYLEHQKRIGRA